MAFALVSRIELQSRPIRQARFIYPALVIRFSLYRGSAASSNIRARHSYLLTCERTSRKYPNLGVWREFRFDESTVRTFSLPLSLSLSLSLALSPPSPPCHYPRPPPSRPPLSLCFFDGVRIECLPPVAKKENYFVSSLRSIFVDFVRLI